MVRLSGKEVEIPKTEVIGPTTKEQAVLVAENLVILKNMADMTDISNLSPIMQQIYADMSP